MQGHSHIVVGVSAAVIINSFEHFTHPALTVPFFLAVLTNVAGSLGPDLDADESTIRHVTHTANSDGCLGKIVSLIMPKHRGWIHSPVLACLLIAVGCVMPTSSSLGRRQLV